MSEACALSRLPHGLPRLVEEVLKSTASLGNGFSDPAEDPEGRGQLDAPREEARVEAAERSIHTFATRLLREIHLLDESSGEEAGVVEEALHPEERPVPVGCVHGIELLNSPCKHDSSAV